MIQYIRYYVDIKFTFKGGDIIKTSHYTLASSAFKKHMRIALVSDLHANEPSAVISALRAAAPDYIFLAGDILEALDGRLDDKNEKAFPVFEACASIAPSFYSTGNHEDGGVHSQSRKWRDEHTTDRTYTEKNIQRIRSSGVHFLIDEYTEADGFFVGGLASGIICEENKPNLAFLREFAALDGPKLLISHHPEYYPLYIKELPIDIILSGHAHGGQWRFFGRGVYAPGQGLFPKYTSGVYDKRLIVSKGLKPSGRIPRIFNPTELVIIDINKGKVKEK